MTTTTTKKNRMPQEQEPLFDDSSDDHSSAESSHQDAGDVVSRSPHDDNSRCAQTRNSMLWAAYADALGFISELVDHKGLKRRTKGTELDRLMEWRRRVGGRGGVDVVLPAGCWSDDTQLRMAVSRTITHHGFDIETFSRIELPVWPAYALGGGRASKAAAKNLGKPGALWYANTFPGWSNAGGNGAAMRIQPHVWSSRNLTDDYLLDVIVDSVCTHGHPRAIVGACFHASTLAHCLRVGTVPDIAISDKIAAGMRHVVHLIEDHPTLGSTWIGLWERETGQQFREVWHDTVDELRTAISHVSSDSNAADGTTGAYQDICDRLGLDAANQRGSGILTTVAAVALAAISQSAHEGIVAAANAVGTDTDTIATMAGALLGACDRAGQPPEEPLDSDYLLSESDRLVAISQCQTVRNQPYPDTLTWAAPQTQADALVRDDKGLAVEGLGPVTELETSAVRTPRNDFAWQWVRTDFGQTLLIKRRTAVRFLGAGNNLEPPPAPVNRSRSRKAAKPVAPASGEHSDPKLDCSVEVDEAVRYAKENINDDAALGRIVRKVAQESTLGNSLTFMREIREKLQH